MVILDYFMLLTVPSLKCNLPQNDLKCPNLPLRFPKCGIQIFDVLPADELPLFLDFIISMKLLII